jgi:peptidyl-prolyl cis-trans isomerase D
LKAFREQAEKVLELARKGDDFAALAEKYSEDTTASKGGDLGYFTRSTMVRPFADTAFSLKKGEISDLVETRFGLHIIKVEDIQEESVQPLAEAKEAIIQNLKEEGGREIVRQRAELLADKARARDDLQTTATEQNLPTIESDFFTVADAIPQLGRSDDLNQIFFSLQPREITPPLSQGDNQVVAQLVDIQDSRLPGFSEVKEKVQGDWIAEESKALARKQAEEWLALARRDGTLAGVAEKSGLELKDTGLFYVSSPPAPLSGQPDLAVNGFALTPEQSILSEVYEVKGSFFILELKESEPATEELFQKEKEDLINRLLAAKKSEAFQLWLDARREQSEIKLLQKI